MFVYLSYPLLTGEETISRYTRFAIKCGVTPVAPHFFCSIDKCNSDEVLNSIEASINLMSFCDEVWILGDEVTKHMEKERDYFESNNKPVRTFTEDRINKYLIYGGDINGP